MKFSESMPKFSSVLLPTAGILLLLFILSGEIYYLFFFNSSGKTQSIPSSYMPLTEMITPTPNLRSSAARTFFNLQNASLAILNTEYSGKVVRINMNGERNGIKYKIDIEMRGQKNNLFRLSFNEEDLSKIKVMKMVNNEKTPMNLNELKADDKLTVRLVIDFLKDQEHNLIAGEIIDSTPL